MKKMISAVLMATLLCTMLMVSPVSAGWDRNTFSFQGTNGYVYCSTGVTYYPAGYSASVEDDDGDYRNLGLELTYYTSSSGSDTVSLYNHDFYLVIEDWGVATTNVVCLVSVDGATTYQYARG